MRTWAFAAASVVLSTAAVFAQSTASISGTITDSSGAVAPEVKVTATHEATGIRSEALSIGNGDYRLPLLRPGTYRIDLQKAGFKSVTRSGIELQVAQGLRANFQLDLGAVTETISVGDSAPLLETDSNVLGGVVSTDKFENIPLKGRNSSAMMLLTPGVRLPSRVVTAPVIESHWQFFSINGSRPNQNQFVLDGSNNNDVGFNGPEYSSPVEAIQEMRVQTNSYSAEYGNAGGGVINTITKSGTNNYHGSLFEYLRNDKFQAGNFFANMEGRQKPALRANQFGGTFGGPIKKNKLFYFGSFEGLRQRSPAVNVISVPTSLQKAGDFSQTLTSTGALVRVADPRSTRPDPARPGQFVRDLFPGNRIPSNRINPVSSAINKYFPEGNVSGLPLTNLNNFFFNGTNPQKTDDVSIRMDYQINDSTQLMGRFSDTFVNFKQPSYFGNIADPYNQNTDQRHMNSVLKLNKTFNPSLVGEFVFSWNRFFHYRTRLSTRNFNPTDLGLPAYVAANSVVLGFPQFNIDGMSPIGGYIHEPHGYDRPNGAVNMIMMRGKHSLKYGGSYNVGRLNGIGQHNNAGLFTSGKSFTQGPDPFDASVASGAGYATFLLGNPTAGTHWPNTTDTAATAKNLGFFFQDDFKVNTKLTLNLGLRWDIESPRTERFNRLTNWNHAGTATLSNGVAVRGGPMFPNLGGLDRGQWNRQTNNWQPRIGLAFNVFKDTVIRTGFGIFYGNSYGGAANYNQLANFGFGCSTPVNASIDGGLTPAASFSDPFPQGFCRQNTSDLGLLSNLGENIAAVNRDHQVPKTISWSFDVQQRLPKDVLFNITYSANRGLNLMGFRELNQLNPEHLALGTQLNAPVPNPYLGVIRIGPLSAATTTRGQLLRPYPQFQTVTGAIDTYGASTYHALFVKGERRFANGFTLLGSYTFSKIIDDAPGGQTGLCCDFSRGDLMNFYNTRGERSIGSYNTPQTLVISYVYELPFGPGKKFASQAGAMGRIVGGWQLSGSSLFQSGTPLQLSGGNNQTFAGTARPNWNGKNPTIGGQDLANAGRARYFDTSAFSLNAPFTLGTAPRYMPNLYGPGNANFDISLIKNTTIRERWRLQFRAEAFNAFNRAQFGNPVTAVNSPIFGTITNQQNQPRDFQMALRLLF